MKLEFLLNEVLINLNKEKIYDLYTICLKISRKTIQSILEKFDEFYKVDFEISDFDSLVYKILLMNLKHMNKSKNKIHVREFVSFQMNKTRELVTQEISKRFNLSNIILTSAYSIDDKEIEKKQLDSVNRLEDEVFKRIIFSEIISKLSRVQRSIVVMRLKGFSFKEIGEELKLKTSDVINIFYSIKKNREVAKIYLKWL